MESLSLEAAAARIRAVDTLAVPLGPGQPASFLHALAGRDEFENDDHSMVCLPSTARVGQRVISRIQARLPLGSIVTTPRHQVDLVVTEYGAAELRGRTTEERARALIEIAHPDARDALRAEEDAVEVG